MNRQEKIEAETMQLEHIKTFSLLQKWKQQGNKPKVNTEKRTLGKIQEYALALGDY